ncbi:glycoside hydrolase family 3 C-terminal domain-containing protein [Sphingobium sufflavum]|uniref:glycoside hydrolase family 3 N-terminal domain-containing protein n=1 Tax=Sphingobium sufflavum TaxID=1129547 RepID=UPI001F38D5E0|nr:glycoside hydrolase family 3 N-terminal domain-containing protein [Sphingobium sufflavum]MCE7798849.1 glycoside hydrolase family 3 C-terminal domain-containing protein [Sphingobium sufflavum]
MRSRFSRRTMLKFTAATALSSAALGKPSQRFRDPTLSIASRVDDLLGRMTLDEKAAQMLCMWTRKREIQDDSANFSTALARKSLKHGIGQIARPSDIRGYPKWDSEPYRSIEDTVKWVNAVQRFLVEETRLGIPALFHDELAHGFLANQATIFPIPAGLGSTWDPTLVEHVFSVAARQARTRGTHIALTPVIDLMREPRYGRSEEFFGEDPFLVSQMGVAAVRGLQGRQRPLGPDKVFATLKHFVHGAPQGGLNIAPADMSERTLRENYLVPFAKVIKQADPAIIMPSYNEVMGVPSHANAELLQGKGRLLLGFRGMYMSDYEGIGNLATQHRVAANTDEAAILALNTGVAADLPEGASYTNLPALVRAGKVKESQLDTAVAQILALKFEAGLFDNPYIDAKRANAAANTAADVALARTAAEKALILLKNDGILPLAPPAGCRIAVIGPNSAEPLFGGYSGATPHAVGICDGIKAAVPAGVVVEQADGVWITPPDSKGRHLAFSPSDHVPEADNDRRIEAAVTLAKRSDIIILVVGDTPAITREAVDRSLPGDRSSLNLYGDQDKLVEALLALGKPMVALLINGRPLAVNRLAERANALVEGWYLGQEGGHAVADLLLGKINPGGKLPVSVARSVGELPVWYNRHPSADVNRYVEGAPTPLFPFGHGLSFTTFELSAPRLSRSTIRVGETVGVEVDVVNSGDRAGDEVVQIYIRDEVSSVPRPVLELKAFQRLTLRPGERQTVRFELGKDDLAFWDINMKWVVEPGAFSVFAGPSSAKLKSATLTVQAA